MDERRGLLKAQITLERPALIGKTWCDPDGEKHPYTSQEGSLLCPLALYFDDEMIVVGEQTGDLHENLWFPFSGAVDKYLHSQIEGSTYSNIAWTQRLNAYYRREFVALVSHKAHMAYGQTKEGRRLLRWYNSFKYGPCAIRQAVLNLNLFLRNPIDLEFVGEVQDCG